MPTLTPEHVAEDSRTVRDTACGLTSLLLDMQKDGPARSTFEAFVKLVQDYKLTKPELDAVMSRDLGKVQAAIQQQLAPPVFIVGWWETK